MSAAKTISPWAVALTLAVPTLGRAQFGEQGLPDLSGIAGSISGVVAPKPTGIFASGLSVPSVSPGATAKAMGRDLRVGVESKTGQKNAGLQALEDEMPDSLAKMEAGLQKLGLAKRDFGVAVGYFFVTNYETATGKTISQSASLAAARTVAKATASRWGSRFKALPASEKESLYEKTIVAPMILNALATQFQKIGKASEAQAMRQGASGAFRTLFGTDPSAIKIDATGRISGFPGGAASAGKTGSGAVAKKTGSASMGLPAGKLTPSSSNGAQVFVMYVTPGLGTSPIRELVLFPDGTAFDDLPSGPIPRFDVASLRAAVRPVYVGRWSKSGNKLTVKIGRDTDVYVKDASGGWADPDMKSGSFGIYFPVKLANASMLAGSWKHDGLTVMGSAGGGAPMVAGGSNDDLTFAKNGTFAKAGKSFAMATTSNMGDAFKSGGDVTVNGGRNRQSSGTWRIDGLMLTTVQNGQRGVQLVYVLPHWNKPTDPPEIMIQGSRWSRPGRD